MTKVDSRLKSRDSTLPTMVHLVKAMAFPVVMYGCESWTIKKAEGKKKKKAKCQRIDAFELRCWRRLESPLDCKEIQPVHPKGDQSCVFIRMSDFEAETAILWPPDAKSWLIWKDPDTGNDWRQEEKGMTEDEMAGWHHWLDGVSLNELRELVMDREAWRAAIHGVTKSRTRLRDWTELNWRPPCPSPTPGVHSNSCPSSQWCHPAISSSVMPFSSCPQSLSASESFPMSQLFTWGGQSTAVSALASFLPKKSQGWSPSE